MSTNRTSKFLPLLYTHDGLEYTNDGCWQRGISLDQLSTVAKNLKLSGSISDPDKLHSIPLPWARLLLFENTLYNPGPNHDEIKNQWRGLLGLLCLAKIIDLGAKLEIKHISLESEQEKELSKVFRMLRPEHSKNGIDQEEGKWDNFDLIYLDGELLGATSPRTLVFTGISPKCPDTIPFRSPQGRLVDPVKYYKNNEIAYLSVLQQWLDNLIKCIKDNRSLEGWLGERPSALDAKRIYRHHQLLQALEDWQKSIGEVSPPVGILLDEQSEFHYPYNIIKPVATAEIKKSSDLLLEKNKKVFVCYDTKKDFNLMDQYGKVVTDQRITIYGGYRVDVHQPLPKGLRSFLPNDIEVIEDPSIFLEDTLIEITINRDFAHCLFLQNQPKDFGYLFPLSKEIFKYFPEDEIKNLTNGISISEFKNTKTLRVTLNLPVAKNRSVQVYKDYPPEKVFSRDNYLTQGLAMWPDFACTAVTKEGQPFFEHYFYYTTNASTSTQIEFFPLTDIALEPKDNEPKTKWKSYFTGTPLLGFIGTVENKIGTLFLKYKTLEPPTIRWKVGINFANEEPDIFYLPVKERWQDEHGFGEGGDLKSLVLRPHFQTITKFDEQQSQKYLTYIIGNLSDNVKYLEQQVALSEEFRKSIDYSPSLPLLTKAEAFVKGASISSFSTFQELMASMPIDTPEKGSDLLLERNKKVFVCYDAKKNFNLVDRYGKVVTDQRITIYGGYRVDVHQPLPKGLKSFLPKDIEVIEDPSILLEDTLIGVTINRDFAHCLFLQNQPEDFGYLFPLSKEIFKYFPEDEIKNLTNGISISELKNTKTLRVTLNLPVAKNRSVQVYKDYPPEKVFSRDNYLTQGLAMWPDFACTAVTKEGQPFFEHYFYYTTDVTSNDQIGFFPLAEENLNQHKKELEPKIVSRNIHISNSRRTWYLSRKPLLGFIGSINGRNGLLLLKYKPIDQPPSKIWVVGIDFGSTHTTVFYKDKNQRNETLPLILPLTFKQHMHSITTIEPQQLLENFFFIGQEQAVKEEFKDFVISTQLAIPIRNLQESYDEWLPREGHVFLSSLVDRSVTKETLLETNLKWNNSSQIHTIRTFLRSLLLLIKAEAIINNAYIEKVVRAYPSAFPQGLKIKHTNEWIGVQQFVNVQIDPEPVSESIAVCRHLWFQGANVQINTIALDIGGSTTDIAIWATRELKHQESIKLAAGVIGQYLTYQSSKDFCDWFMRTVTDTLKLKIQGSDGKSQPSINLDRTLFNAVLSRLSERGQIWQFINTIKGSMMEEKSVNQFLSYVAFVYAALSYFTGLLTRAAKIESETYYIYFCGRGGQFYNWIPGSEELVKSMFMAGLLEPGSPDPSDPVEIKINLSKAPKQEVGQGLLVNYKLVDIRSSKEDYSFKSLETVTAGETGYTGINFGERLTLDKILTVDKLEHIPTVDKLPELNNFVDKFCKLELPVTEYMARMARKVLTQEKGEFRNKLYQKLSDNLIQEKRSDILIESFFIKEVKILLAMILADANKPTDANRPTTGVIVSDDLFE